MLGFGAVVVAVSAVAADRWDRTAEKDGAAMEERAETAAPGRTESPSGAAAAPSEDAGIEAQPQSPESASGTAVDGEGETVRLMEALEAALRSEEVPPEHFPKWLMAFSESYDSQRQPITVVEADFDGDGTTEEWAAVLYEDVRGESPEQARRTAYATVVARQDGQYAISGFEFPEESFGRANIEVVEDLTGDGRPDIVWGSYSVGAHTVHAVFSVSSRANGELGTARGTADMPNVSGVAVRDGKLALTGGLIGSAGAGPWQREYTDEYVVAEGALVRANREYPASPTSYHRLIDALWAEALGNAERAKTLLAEAIELDDESYAGYVFETDDGVVEGGTQPDREAAFEATVEQFARLRLELLTRTERGASREDACAEARNAAEYDAGWLPLLNSPFGYANPKWDELTICSEIDELTY